MTEHLHHHDLSRATHTPELQQVHDINAELAQGSPAGRSVTAEDLGLAGQPVRSGTGAGVLGGLPASAVLEHLSAEGPPDFPYLTARFRTATEPGTRGPLLQVEMHTESLRALSRTLHLRHIWGA